MNTSAEPPDATPGNDACKSCGSTERSPRSANHCKCGKMLPGNRAAAIVGQHGAQFWRDQTLVLSTVKARLLSDAGFSTPEAAPLTLQIAAASLAQAVIVRDSAYKRMVESGGPLAESGKPRRAYTVWASSNENLIRDLRGAISEFASKAPASAVDFHDVTSLSSLPLRDLETRLMHVEAELWLAEHPDDRRSVIEVATEMLERRDAERAAIAAARPTPPPPPLPPPVPAAPPTATPERASRPAPRDPEPDRPEPPPPPRPPVIDFEAEAEARRRRATEVMFRQAGKPLPDWFTR